MNNASKKIVVGALAIVLVLALAIGGTLAYLTDSEKKTNVFAVGDLDITLDEPNWDPDDGTDLHPGKTMPKDPIISEIENDSYMRVYVSIIDKVATIPNPAYVDDDTTPLEPKEIANPNLGKVITDTDRLDLIYQTIYYDSSYNKTTGTGAIDNTKMYSLAQLAALTTVKNGVNDNAASGEFTKDTAHSSAGETCYIYHEVGGSTAGDIFNEGDDVTLFTNVVIPTDWNQEDMALLGEYDIVIYAQAIQSAGFATAGDAFDALDGEVTAGTIQQDHGIVTP